MWRSLSLSSLVVFGLFLDACERPRQESAPAESASETRRSCVQTLQLAQRDGPQGLTVAGIAELEACGEQGLGLVALGLDSENSKLRQASAQALARGRMFGARLLVAACLTGKSARQEFVEAAWRAVLSVIEDRRADERQQAPALLARLIEVDETHRQRGLDALRQLLGDQDAGVRQAALRAVAMLGERAFGLREQVAHCLVMDSRDGLRGLAADILGRLGEGGAEELKRLLEHEDPDVRRHVLSALGRLGLAQEEMRALLAARIKDEDSLIRRAAFDAILPLAVEGPGLDLLLKGLDDPSPEVRKHVLRLSAQLPANKVLVEALREVLRQGEADEVELAAERLAAMGPEAGSAYADLLERAGRGGGGEQGAGRACLKAALRLQAKPEKLAADLGRLFEKGRSEAVRVLAAEQLGALGRKAQSQEALLRKGMVDQSMQIRSAALNAMMEIRRDAPAGST